MTASIDLTVCIYSTLYRYIIEIALFYATSPLDATLGSQIIFFVGHEHSVVW